MEFIAVCADTAIAAFAPVYRTNGVSTDKRYKHLPLATIEEEDNTLMGIATTGIPKGNMGSVLVSGLHRIQNSNNTFTKQGEWVVTNNTDQVHKLGYIVSTENSYGPDGEEATYVVSVMPWVNHLTFETKLPTAEMYTELGKKIAAACTKSILENSNQLNENILSDAVADLLKTLVPILLKTLQKHIRC